MGLALITVCLLYTSAFIREDEGMQLVYVPDFAILTEGHELVDAIEMARDAIGMTGKAYEEDGKLSLIHI